MWTQSLTVHIYVTDWGGNSGIRVWFDSSYSYCYLNVIPVIDLLNKADV